MKILYRFNLKRLINTLFQAHDLGFCCARLSYGFPFNILLEGSLRFHGGKGVGVIKAPPLNRLKV